MSTCVICHVPSEKKCTQCGEAYYCSREHQKEDWKTHKLICIPYRIETNKTLGSHLVGTRKMNRYDVILREAALFSGPSPNVPPVCLGCYRVLRKDNHIRCTQCGWPMCSLDCSKSSRHYPECYITSTHRGSKVKIETFGKIDPTYEIVRVLRCLYLRESKPKVWQKIQQLESHMDKQKKSQHIQKNMGKYIREVYKYTAFSEEEILKVAYIIEINSQQIGPHSHGLYYTASFFEHNCQANCIKTFDMNGDVVVRAARPLDPSEHLSICYTDSMLGTARRRAHLHEAFFFSCCCARCSDPTELGSHFSSLKCFDPAYKKSPYSQCKGFLTPSDPFKSDETHWTCNVCGVQMESDRVMEVINRASERHKKLDQSKLLADLQFIKDFEKLLHPHHYLMTDVKLSVTQVAEVPIREFPDDVLELKLRYCKELNNFLPKLVPSENNCLGVLLFSLHTALAEHGRRKLMKGDSDGELIKNSYMDNLLECKMILTECCQLLQFEPPQLPDGQVYLQAKKFLDEILRNLKVLLK